MPRVEGGGVPITRLTYPWIGCHQASGEHLHLYQDWGRKKKGKDERGEGKGGGGESRTKDPPARESGATRQVEGPNMRSREKALRQAGLSSEKGPHMSLSDAALSRVVCCWNSRYM